VGTLLTEQALYSTQVVFWWQCWGIHWLHFPLACEDSNNWYRMFQPKINDHKPHLVVPQA